MEARIEEEEEKTLKMSEERKKLQLHIQDLEETLEEVEDSGTCLALHESVSKSRERNKERNEIGENEKKSR